MLVAQPFEVCSSAPTQCRVHTDTIQYELKEVCIPRDAIMRGKLPDRHKHKTKKWKRIPWMEAATQRYINWSDEIRCGNVSEPRWMKWKLKTIIIIIIICVEI